MATGYAPKRILELASGKGATARVLRAAVARIGAYTLERALLGELSHQVALAVLSTLEGDAVPVAPERIEVVMDDAAERWSR